jgi:hypothetical protein
MQDRPKVIIGIDLLLRWLLAERDGRRHWQREAFEPKVWREGRPDPLPEGLEQLDASLDRLGLDHGALVDPQGAAWSRDSESAMGR